MTPAAPRIDARLHAALARIDDGRVPIAEVNRLGLVAAWIGIPRPSYEHVRRLVHAQRRRGAYPTVGDVFLKVAATERPPAAVVEHLLGLGPHRRRDR